MGISSTLYSALSGLNTAQTRLDVVGNNIANINTTAFKGSRALFQTQFSRTFSFGSPPGTNSGGTNPIQLGLGAADGAIQRDFGVGSIETTGVKSDVAIEGEGFFVLQDGSGSQVFTRDGAFTLDEQQKLVSADGRYVMGYTVDSDFNIISGALSEITIPLGKLSIAQATTTCIFEGNLDAGGDVATAASTVLSEPLNDSSTGLAATGTSLLTDLETAASPGVPLFAVGDQLTLTAQKGGKDLPTATFTVTAAPSADVDSGSTLAEYMEWLQTRLGIHSYLGATPTPGVTVTATGEIQIVGNLGEDNNLTVDVVSDGTVSHPMSWDATDGNGSSVSTSFWVYDTLGNPVQVNLTAVLVEKASTGNTWRFFVDSPDDTDSLPVGTGTITFDSDGRLLDSAQTQVVIDRQDTGAADPLSFNLDFSRLDGLAADSKLNMDRQDGVRASTLQDFAIGFDGTIMGTFSSGLTRPLGQLVLATFSNPEGLIAGTDNVFLAGPNSGEPSITAPQTLGAGKTIGGALELSNVDLTREFINMISASTGFSAAGKVITTSEQLLRDLLSMYR